MNIESELKKGGINVIEPLDIQSRIVLAKNVSKRIADALPNFGFNFDTLFERFSKLPMYVAEMPEGLAEASYFYKNSSIYFRDGMGLNDLEKFAIHEFIHNLQEVKDEKGNLRRLGLCTFNNSKVFGVALNEAAVQLIASNVLDSTFENVTYYDINFSTISSNCYPIICNLISQMAYVTGEEVLFDSTLHSNDHFKNKFSAICGESTYIQVAKSFDKILELEEKIANITNKLQTKDLSISKSTQLSNKISDLKLQVKNTYFSTQELITKSFFNSIFKSLITSADMDRFRKKLYNFQELTGTTEGYHFFNNYYIEMMENLDKKFDKIMDYNSPSTYLIPVKENKFVKFIRYIKKLIWKKELENENEK